MQQIPGQITGEHVLLTGPIRGPLELEDGTTVDVTPEFVDVGNLSAEQLEELNFLIGEHWVENGHPNDVDVVDGERIQRQFTHDYDKKFDKHPKKFKGKAAGKPLETKKD